MSQSSQLIAQQYRNGELNKRMFGEAFYIVTAYGIFPDGTDVTNKLQALVNLANSEGRTAIFFPHGDYLVTYINNDENIRYFGDNARFVGGYNKEIAQLGDPSISDAQASNFVVGTEYLVYYHEKIRTQQPVKLVFSGDSTTEGVAITDEKYLIHNISKSILTKYGVREVTSINAGHSNMRTPQWQNQYLAEDLAQSPDLYVLRWGLNDGAHLPITDRLQVFKDALRGGLATMRAQKNVQQMSVILMMPNSTYDVPYGRDATWFNEILPVIRQAARDYQCCFIDTYNYLLDSKNVIWQDTPMGDGVSTVHPLNIGNAWIANLTAESLVPSSLRTTGSVNQLSSDGLKTPTDPPTAYPYGNSMHRTFGFPYDGFVTTFQSADGILMQWNTSYIAAEAGIAFRRGMRNIGVPGAVGSDSWGAWAYLTTSPTKPS